MKHLLVVGLVLAALVAGCGDKTVNVPFEAIALADLPPEVREWALATTRDRVNSGSGTMAFGGHSYLLVYGGVLPSQGYTVTFHKVERKGVGFVVTATIDGPSRPWSSATESPLGVARIAGDARKIAFDVSQKSVPPETVRAIQTGPVALDLNQLQDIQTQVDNGHQPWRLDPLQVVMDEGRKYGFNPAAGDRFEVISRSGAEATVEAKVGSQTYLVKLKQPFGTRLGAIWTIVAVQLR